MSIFDKFNNQGLKDEDAFEELCCQLFETWGCDRGFLNEGWTYRDIRGSGGDGGIEAYWRKASTDEWIGIQAKWFRQTIADNQYSQIRKSVNTALKIRPKLHRYIVCIPHNLTSMKNTRDGITLGEEADWAVFEASIKETHPALQLELWDESTLLNLLQNPSNEGRWRFWFEKSAINPMTISTALDKSIASIKDRYIPELADDGGLSAFLDGFYGTQKSRLALLRDIDTCLAVCEEIIGETQSLLEISERLPDEMPKRANACIRVLREYAEHLEIMRDVAAFEPPELTAIEQHDTDCAAIEAFESCVLDCKNGLLLHGHIDALSEAIDRFRELSSEWEMVHNVSESLGSPHCIIVGEQGTGKTCGLATKAVEFKSNKEHLPILIKAADVDDNDGWRDIIIKRLGLGGDWGETELWQALSSSAAIKDMRNERLRVCSKAAILIDGLDERSSVKRWQTLIREADAIAQSYPRIRFAFSSRPNGIDFDAGSKELLGCRYNLDPTGDVPAYKLFDRYIKHYDIDVDGNTQYKWLLRSPMELWMFCNAYRGQKLCKNVSTCMTDLINAEIERLEAEFAARCHQHIGHLDTPVRTSLAVLANCFLRGTGLFLPKNVSELLISAGINAALTDDLLVLLENYGVLNVRREAGDTPFSPPQVTYQPGSRHLWDYFIAQILITDSSLSIGSLLPRHMDAAGMYAVLLVERKGELPLDCSEFVEACGEPTARDLTLYALATSMPSATARFRGWALDELELGGERFSDFVNDVIIRIADESEHPLGPKLLDEYLRAFDSPTARDAVWSLPNCSYSGYSLSMYEERNLLKHMPSLRDGSKHNQMPLVFAWALASVSNLKRSYCRGQLVTWGLANPSEFSEVFAMFCDCDDPQIREDMYAIAEEIVCQGNASPETEAVIGKLAFDAVFSEPDKPGNRNAAIRYYGRILIERCVSDGVLAKDFDELCRPPYTLPSSSSPMPIYPDACKADRMDGYGQIHYGLARYVLVDQLESSFGLPHYGANDMSNEQELNHLIDESASAADVEAPDFEGWVIAAAYQYLIDRGYDLEVFEGPLNENGYRVGGIDHKIIGSFHQADHGSRSIIMTVAEKYVWCARNEICGYLADRIPINDISWLEGGCKYRNDDGLSLDYGMLLDYDSPLLESTVQTEARRTVGLEPTFPMPFSCDSGTIPCTEEVLRGWIDETPADAACALVSYEPTLDTRIRSEKLPVNLYACDWGYGGKTSMAWINGGFVDSSDLARLGCALSACLDGYRHSSNLESGISSSGAVSYISPVEFLASPWVDEVNDHTGVEMVADVHLEAEPLSGNGVSSLTDTGDYWYFFPSKQSRGLCGITRTDGVCYFDGNSNTLFEEVRFGTPYRHDYHGLLANRSVLLSALRERGKAIIWYATIRRYANSLATERFPDLKDPVERSWVLWMRDDGSLASCPISEEEAIDENRLKSMADAQEALDWLLDKYSLEESEEGGCSL